MSADEVSITNPVYDSETMAPAPLYMLSKTKLCRLGDTASPAKFPKRPKHPAWPVRELLKVIDRSSDECNQWPFTMIRAITNGCLGNVSCVLKLQWIKARKGMQGFRGY